MDSRRFCAPEDAFSYKLLLAKPDLKGKKSLKKKVSPSPAAFCRVAVLSSAAGSAYVECGRTKVVCGVYGPKEIPRRSDFSIRGLLSCRLSRTPFSSTSVAASTASSMDARRKREDEERREGLALRDALAATVRLVLALF